MPRLDSATLTMEHFGDADIVNQLRFIFAMVAWGVAGVVVRACGLLGRREVRSAALALLCPPRRP